MSKNPIDDIFREAFDKSEGLTISSPDWSKMQGMVKDAGMINAGVAKTVTVKSLMIAIVSTTAITASLMFINQELNQRQLAMPQNDLTDERSYGVSSEIQPIEESLKEVVPNATDKEQKSSNNLGYVGKEGNTLYEPLGNSEDNEVTQVSTQGNAPKLNQDKGSIEEVVSFDDKRATKPKKIFFKQTMEGGVRNKRLDQSASTQSIANNSSMSLMELEGLKMIENNSFFPGSSAINSVDFDPVISKQKVSRFSISPYVSIDYTSLSYDKQTSNGFTESKLNANSNNQLLYTVGFFVDYDLSYRTTIETGVLYSHKGAVIDSIVLLSSNEGKLSAQYDLSGKFIEIPLRLKYRIWKGMFNWYVKVGANLMVNAPGQTNRFSLVDEIEGIQTDVNLRPNSFGVAGTFATGMEFELGNNKKLFIEPSYRHSLTSSILVEDFKNIPLNPSFNTISLGVGLNYTLWSKKQ